MLHCFRALGVNIALDVLSGAVHVLDDMAFEALTDLEAGRDPRPALLAKYAEKDVDELLDEIEALRAQARSSPSTIIPASTSASPASSRHVPARGARLQPALPLLLCLHR